MIFNQTLWILACARDCGCYLPQVFDNLDRLRPYFESLKIFILENDSTDDTFEQIQIYANNRSGISARGMRGIDRSVPVRTERLAHLRNGLIGWLRRETGFKLDDLVLVLDCDEVNAEPWDLGNWPDVLAWFLSQKDAAAVFANQRGPYYDLWALRHPQRCPVDVWQQVLELHCRQPQLSDLELIEQAFQPWQFSLDPLAAPERVKSAFGGLGFYKMEWLWRNEGAYSGSMSRWIDHPDRGLRLIRWQVAEHVAFHAGLRAAGGSLWIHPGLINWTTAALPDLRPNPSSWRHLSF